MEKILIRSAASLRNIMALPGVQKGLSLLAYAQPLLLAIVTYVVASWFAGIGVDAHHDGIMFKPALDVAEGKMLFRDTFTQYGALTTLLQALALKLFGHYLLVIKLQTAFFYALTVYFLWLIWKRFIPQWLATGCGLIYIGMAPYFLNIIFINRSPNYGWWFLPWSSVYALFFLVLSLYFIILFIEKRARAYMLAAGASVALTLWCRQPVGVLLFGALSCFLVGWCLFEKSIHKEFSRRAALFLAGFFIVNALFLGWLLCNHALKDMWLQSVAFASMWAQQHTTARTLPMLLAILFPPCQKFSSSPSFVWSALPAVCLILFFRTAANYLWKKPFDEKQALVFAAVMVCLASWGQYYPLLYEQRTYWSAAPMIGVFAYFVWDLLRNENPLVKGVLTLLALGLLFQADITRRIQEGRLKLHQEYVALNYPRIFQGMQAPPHDALFFQTIAADIDDYFRQHPEGGLMNASLDALFPAFVENLENFHPLQTYINWSGFNGLYQDLYPDYFPKRDEYAAKRRPIIISHNHPMIYAGYTIKSLGRDMYVTAPDAADSPWQITAFRCIEREPDAPLDAARDYCLDMQFAGTNETTLRWVGATACDFDGTIRGVWHPVTQATHSIRLDYVAAPTNDALEPLSCAFMIPAGGKIELWLTGHDMPHYSTAMKVTMAAIVDDNPRSQQIISFLPLFKPTPAELINLSLRRFRSGDFHGCIQAAEDALRLFPDCAAAYNNICAAWNELGEWEKAAAAGERAVALDPGSVLAGNNLALARSRAMAKP